MIHNKRSGVGVVRRRCIYCLDEMLAKISKETYSHVYVNLLNVAYDQVNRNVSYSLLDDLVLEPLARLEQ